MNGSCNNIRYHRLMVQLHFPGVLSLYSHISFFLLCILFFPSLVPLHYLTYISALRASATLSPFHLSIFLSHHRPIFVSLSLHSFNLRLSVNPLLYNLNMPFVGVFFYIFFVSCMWHAIKLSPNLWTHSLVLSLLLSLSLFLQLSALFTLLFCPLTKRKNMNRNISEWFLFMFLVKVLFNGFSIGLMVSEVDFIVFYMEGLSVKLINFQLGSQHARLVEEVDDICITLWTKLLFVLL